MHKVFPTIIFIVVTLIPANSFANDQNISTVLNRVVNNFVRPGYEKFLLATLDQKANVDELCSNPGSNSLEKARAAFTRTAASWGQIEIIRFGPVSSENRFERILFYPDRKSTGLKQVQRILSTQDETVLDINRLPKKSVAVQGLGAMEFLLFGTGSDGLEAGDAFRCAYAQAASSNLSIIAREISQNWNDNGAAYKIWTNPGPANPVLKNQREGVNTLLGTLVHGLESIRDLRISAFLRSEPAKDRPRVALFRRSENTLMMISHNIEATRKLFSISDAKLLLSSDDKPLFDNVLFELENAQRMADSIQSPISVALQNPEQRAKIEYLKTSISFAIQMLDEDFAIAAGLSSGFSFSDGD
ncbi:MAG: imelysin family protein [Pseudomonadota bacterium]